MSAEAQNWAYGIDLVFDSPVESLRIRLKMGAKFTLVTLGDFADQEHSCYPSINTLAAKMSCSRSSVKEYLATLQDWGLVTVQKRRRANGSQSSSRYYLPVGTWAPKGRDGRAAQRSESDPSQSATPEPVDNSHSQRSDSDLPPAGIRPPLNNHPNQRNSSGQVPNATTGPRALAEGTGPRISPATVSATHGRPFQPADVFASVGPWMPTTFDDEQLHRLAAEILAEAPGPVLDRTVYVITAIRNTVKHSEKQRGRWLLRADEIAYEAIAYAEQGRAF